MSSDATATDLVQVDQSVFDAAGKVLAVHLSYSSRAAQRGRTPAFPSYFMKASSSLAAAGSTVERPAGTELLAFEGEIALVIGTDARRVSVEDAWSHVGSVTASNDLGVYDMKYADKGSNIRSKSGDGYTPMGPVLLPAASVNPAALRIRTWVNGEIAQDATTAELIFSFAQIVADLSQQMTLKAGDVILTGTPAGSSVIVPGDTVEVEVDDEAAGLSTGRLATTVVEGSATFADFGNQPKITDADRIDAFGTASAAGIELPITGKEALTNEVKAKLLSVATATISGALRKRGLNNVSVDGLQATKGMTKVIGTARTLRYVPNREDLFKSHGGGYNAQKRVIDSVGPGEILVMEARGEKGSGTLGDILAMRTQVRGAEAIITDGGVRDLDAVAALDIPTFHNGAHPAVLGRKHVPWDTDVTIGCGGATIQPGDIVIADADGILVIPPHLAAEIADEVVESERQDTFVFKNVSNGAEIKGLFPMNADWKAKYNQWVADGEPDF
ncbi:fumarylacetoacetate hydrolase family protein [Paeniglutamicibacter kerguelensis]|uniref:2-keto-4-pentenoate hydratase/2-oxohepta-3-ene-1,7-dioic acid hydratase in catechol pathway/regulator of RNase E activity RraA n=1 Tax=Paeniglutamicibacter kerguelensis TaxID=254788 RepID=A0ABS4XAJ7_9MICC|nr:2-keto-4-pentenoate hydratase/2-oxohepta-3-ene-1,7-dioic acid hydratase in catechol pathway/regulator of RNase E activity RraA [Paeniglutamicibacter kerguelensis]